MAIVQIDPTLGAGSEYDLAAVSTWANTNAFGRDRVSLTEWDTTTVPEVAAGSIIEAGGALYEITTDTAITVGSVSDGFVFIVFDTTASSETFYLTNSIPVWDSELFGYYDTASTYKVLPFIMLKSSTSYTMKQVYDIYGYLNNSGLPMFEVKRNSVYTFSGSTTTPIEITNIWDSTSYNFNSSFNATTGRFTAPHTGFYSFFTSGFVSGSTLSYLGIVKNSTDAINTSYASSITSPAMKAPTALNIPLQGGDYISLFYQYSGTASWRVFDLLGGGVDKIIFSGFKVG